MLPIYYRPGTAKFLKFTEGSPVMVSMGTNNGLLALAAFLGAIPEIVRQGLFSYYSDYHKDCHGIRPRWAGDYSIAQLEDEIAWLDQHADEYMHEQVCDLCYHGETCREHMPTSGEGWSFTPAA